MHQAWPLVSARKASILPMNSYRLVCAAAFICTATSIVRADLQTLGIWNGNVGLSIDAVGSNSSPVGTIQASVPVGSTILAAYLYSAGVPTAYTGSPTTLGAYNGAGITLAGTPVTNFSALVGATSPRSDIVGWATARADVTSLVTSLVGAGSAVPFNWIVAEGAGLNSRIDGEVLAIVYSNPTLPAGSVALLNGGQNTNGETTTVNLGSPLGNVADAAFFAEMSLGISFSFQPGQTSTVDVNGNRITSSAGGFNDGAGSDGALITAGGIGDSNANPASPLSTSSADDELYNLAPFLTTGATSFNVFTTNPTDDDNIFFMGLRISGNITTVNEPPPTGVPDGGATIVLLGGAMAALVTLRRRFSNR